MMGRRREYRERKKDVGWEKWGRARKKDVAVEK